MAPNEAKWWPVPRLYAGEVRHIPLVLAQATTKPGSRVVAVPPSFAPPSCCPGRRQPDQGRQPSAIRHETEDLGPAPLVAAGAGRKGRASLVPCAPLLDEDPGLAGPLAARPQYSRAGQVPDRRDGRRITGTTGRDGRQSAGLS